MQVDIVSGFLGAGKTTLIKKILDSNLKEEKIVVIENEFGEVSIDGRILERYGINIKEINSGCICCSLTKDFKESLKDIKKLFNPDRIIIEPSGVAKLSDVIKSISEVREVKINNIITVIDALNFENYLENFDEFYVNQIKSARLVFINDRGRNDKSLLNSTELKVKELNKRCEVVTLPIDNIDIREILKPKEEKQRFTRPSFKTGKIHKEEVKHEHHHSSEFSNISIETNKIFTEDNLKKIFITKVQSGGFGNVLRAKGMVELESKKWIEFHYTPGMFNIYKAEPQKKGIVVFIGDVIDKEEIKSLFS
ncbi:GTPase, G3E family [Clostridium sp. DSM 8431]|uniref:CobW family GTP-binding protein n=1 Tax=Clostridium sp. DSM 8431 TaxID=1761781 RepID=UPI0008E62E85|nr:GTP-binding protein [Clostridium sp. DSM 8431]SFU52688.1 GTPase, G3E family [Clostridium sp. DSM 8431]